MKGVKAREKSQAAYRKVALSFGTQRRMVMSESDGKINLNSCSGD